jgi:hypothetical protein
MPASIISMTSTIIIIVRMTNTNNDRILLPVIKAASGGGLPRRRLQPAEIIGSALRMAGGAENRAGV